MEKYDHKSIEAKWQKSWEEANLFKAPDVQKGKENYFVLVEFPYPSGNLHIGHWYAFAVPDIFARKKRMEGKNVLFPIGFDSFGLPAENAAIKHGVDPKKWTYDNIAHMTDQLKSMGSSFDWSRRLAASDPQYYKWTQWLFLKLYEKGLAYKGKAVVNWDPVDKTVLANEQVLPDGTAERSGAKVEKKELEQWFFRITDYAERLIEDLKDLNWPEEIKQQQRNWIGRSEGAEIVFQIPDSKFQIPIFTTRPDTLFGATYMVLAPEHPLISNIKYQISN
ncbi:MAG: class I tRNA ligase family protein, partial [Candidatus Doudnabacteria bacterium]|nr:class I tRNA ligase family protein [Candidatus Doudnabacteria bacterium]